MKKFIMILLTIMIVGTQVQASTNNTASQIYTVNGTEHISIQALNDLGINVEKLNNGNYTAKKNDKNITFSSDEVINTKDIIYLPMKETSEALDIAFDFNGKEWKLTNGSIVKEYPIYSQQTYKSKTVVNKKVLDKEISEKKVLDKMIEIKDDKGLVIGYANADYAEMFQQMVYKMEKESSPTIPKIENVSAQEDLKLELEDILGNTFKCYGTYYIDMAVLQELDIDFLMKDNTIIGITNRLNNKNNKAIICKKPILNIDGHKFIELHKNLIDLDVTIETQEANILIANGNNEVTVETIN